MRLGEYLSSAKNSVLGLFRTTREAYSGASHHDRIRVGILAVLALDVVLVLGVFAGVGGRPAFEAWFQPGFPSNMLVIKNESGRVLDRVEIVVDGTYRAEVERLGPGIRGFELSREFRDANQRGPKRDYRPERVQVLWSDDQVELRVEQRQ